MTSAIATTTAKAIFPPWDFSTWTDVDDRVRGGSSTSHLEPAHFPGDDSSDKPSGARFYGHLDIDTLGGAGFASQRYRFGPEPLHLPRTEYQGVTLTIARPSNSMSAQTPHANTFTLVLKTSFSTRPPSRPKTPPQPEPASLSYEASFTPSSYLNGDSETIYLAFDDFKVTYRGREVPKDDPKRQPFHPEKIYELSLMCRSNFAEQKGDFELVFGEIKGWKKTDMDVRNSKENIEGQAVGWFRSAWETLRDFVAGFFVWIRGVGEGQVQLRDEEKGPLV